MSDPRAVRQRNCTLVASGHGTRTLYAPSFGHGVDIVSDEAESKDGRALYVSRVTTSPVTLNVEFPKETEYDAFGAWMRDYIQKLSAGSAGPMRILIPDRRFDRTAIPLTGTSFGAQSGRVVYSMSLTFMTTADPLSPFSSLIAKYELPYGDRYNVSRFHPAGIQVGGAVDRQLYDSPEDVTRQTGIVLGHRG